jgi:hypothetical protein
MKKLHKARCNNGASFRCTHTRAHAHMHTLLLGAFVRQYSEYTVLPSQTFIR